MTDAQSYQNTHKRLSQSHNNKIIGVNAMIEQQAIIIANEAGYAWVMPDNTASCGACAEKANACSTLSLATLFRPKTTQALKVFNPMYAKVGERVVVGVKSDIFLLYSALAYALPLVTMLIGAILGTSIFAALDLNHDLGAMLAGMAGLAVGFGLARNISTWSQKLEHFQPVILRKLWDVQPISFSYR